jgi:hypothetical protein
MTDPQPQPRQVDGVVRRDVPTLVHDGDEWVRARYYDRAVEVRENANAVSVRVELENRRLREAVQRFLDDEIDAKELRYAAL